ncbi:hypothetical protein PT114_08780 [Erysipelothrix rhusiopathiae]|nr:hypothetical protein [Erysipelothrix rhusiopathiae]
MDNYKNAVVSFLSLYKFAKLKKQLDKNPSNYDYIIYKVEDYFEQLELYEIEVLELRYIENYSLEKIANALNYKSHSSVSSIINKNLLKLATYEKQLINNEGGDSF